MNSYLVYRASFYLMLVVATMASSADATGSRFARMLPLAVAAASVVAFFTVDRHRNWALPHTAINALGVLSLGAVYYETKLDDGADPSQMFVALGHWLVYLQVINYFRPKRARDDWTLFVLGLMQVLIGAVVNPSDQVGTWLFLWALLAVCVLGQFFLQREALRFVPAPGPKAAAVLPAGPADPYPGLFDLPNAVATMRVMATTLALGGLIFLALPRRADVNKTQAVAALPKHLTGFDEEVQLGQLGEILENDSVVFTVSFSDRSGKAIDPPDEPLWRGVTMLRYETGHWSRQPQRPAQEIVAFSAADRKRVHPREIRQKIKLEPNDSRTLFAIRPVRKMDAPPGRLPPNMNPLDGTLFRPERGTGPYDYDISSHPDPNAPQIGENPPNDVRTEWLLYLPEDLKARLRKIAEPVVAHIPGEGEHAIAARARALEAFLRDSGKFTYSLRMEVVDPTLDPVEDFLINTKQGHCEYFASALALLLRSIDIPTRIVNGFKGGDWNMFTQTMSVRQKHAHSWVEAYAGLGTTGHNVPFVISLAGGPTVLAVPSEPFAERVPIWIPLDPTPGIERAESIAQVGGIAGSFRPFTDTLRHVWVFYIVGYDGERQNRLLYAPMSELLREAGRQYARLRRWLNSLFRFLFHFRDVSSFISARGFIVTFMGGSVLLGLAYLAYRIALRALALLRGQALDATSLTAGILFYRRLAQLLAQYDLKRMPTETQGEFALRAQSFLKHRGPLLQTVAGVPRQVVDAFYRVRFGHLDLEPHSLAELDERLDALEATLKSRGNPSGRANQIAKEA